MRNRAKRTVSDASEWESHILSSYVEGVNAGLTSLEDLPFEYILLGEEPAPWRAEDSVLVLHSMFFTLNDPEGTRESALGLMHDLFPGDLAWFLAPRGTEWDAPVDGHAFVLPPIPNWQETLTGVAARGQGPEPPADFDFELSESMGSNNWAVSGSRTSHGGALLASDMHLSHSVPNVWYRAAMSWDGRERVVGVTLPGAPFLVAGSNGDIAWGFTNSAGDWVDLVEIEPDPSSADRYRTPEGFASFEVHEETILVRDGSAESFTVRETIWGPVIDEDHRGVERASRWIAHDAHAVNTALSRLEEASDLDEAISLAHGAGIPPQNFVVVDGTGRIAWTIAGRIPRRVGFEGRVPHSWASGERRWEGWLDSSEYPVIEEPENGTIWTANARVVSGADLAKIGDGGYALGARARQIRDGLLGIEPGKADEASMLAIQLDDRAVFLERWRDLFLDALDGAEALESADSRSLSEAKRFIEQSWSGRASVESVGYRLVKRARLALFDTVFGYLTAKLREADERFRIATLRQWEAPLWQLVTERPTSFVPPPHETWDDVILSSIERAATTEDGVPLAERTWGETNRSAIRHPLSRGAPFLSSWLDIPPRPLPGDRDMPRVQSPSHGASERFVVSPGREERGIFHMPGGQSGHPMSPFYRAGHEAWEEGRATPFLPGEPVYELTLVPASASVPGSGK
jgi:penicillin amidase